MSPETLAARRPVSKTRDLRIEVVIKARPEQVYQALTSARELCRWWLDLAETDARNTGRLRMVWPRRAGRDGFREKEGCFVDLEPGRKVAWLWKPGPRRGDEPPLCSFFLRPKGRGCEVTLLHAGFSSKAASDRAFRDFGARWEDALAKLKLYLETGRTRKADALALADLNDLLKEPS